MRREELGDLAAFMAVAEERSFTRAAARLGTSQSALSHTIRRLETRLGVRLLARTTRSVVATQAGERLLATLRPALDDIDAELDYNRIGQLLEYLSGKTQTFVTTSKTSFADEFGRGARLMRVENGGVVERSTGIGS